MATETASEVTVKKGKETFSLDDPKLAQVIGFARNLNAEIKGIEPALKEYKEYIADRAKDYIDTSGTLTFIAGGVSCKVTFGYECVVPADRVEEVRRLLGDRFEDLVKVKTTYNGTSKLIEMAADADRGKLLASCLVVKEKTPGIRFEEAA